MSVTILRGASGSGKSTFARDLHDTLIISRDIIRQSFGAVGKTVLPTEQEREVTKIELDMLRRAIVSGRDVVIDDTNLEPHVIGRFIDECHIYGVEPEIIKLWELLDVLLGRRTEVPKDVVIRQHMMGFKPPLVRVPLIEPLLQDFSRDPVFVFDIDGTLAHINPNNPRDVYDGSRVYEDIADYAVKLIANLVEHFGYGVMVVSGRDEKYRDETGDWLFDKGIPCDELYMRPEGDTRHDVAIKYEIMQDLVNRRHIVGVFDDRTRVTTAYRTMGLKVFQVEDWIRSDF